MSILNIKERFSQRILESEKDKKSEAVNIGSVEVAKNVPTTLFEGDVGITEYVSILPGFHAVIKQRFSDFNVHEIDINGKLAILNSEDVPSETDDTAVVIDDCPYISNDNKEKLEKLVLNTDNVDSVSIDVTEYGKDERKNIHKYIKGKYGVSVVSNTLDVDDKKIITVVRDISGTKDIRRPDHLGKYVHFILCKSNMDTHEALSIIGSKLRIKSFNFNISGTKDKRANTTQWVSVRHVLASKLKTLNSSLRKMRIGNFCYKNYHLKLGLLQGNNFQIALRNLTAPDSEITLAVEKLKENGFINYFGLQRFGNSAECSTHEIGKHIITESFGQAIELILKPRTTSEPPDMRRAREIWVRTRDPAQALAALRRRDRTIEAQILSGLKKHGPNAFVNVLDGIPRNVCLLYLHAYQSLIWNKVVSRRIAKHGLNVLAGDLVLMGKSAEILQEIEPSEEQDTDSETLNGSKSCPVRPITALEVSKYTVHDVLLPIPGDEIIYPDNEIAKWYDELLECDGLTSDSWKSRIRKYSLPGSYRKIVMLPGNVSWRTVTYDNPEDDLILSDIDMMDGKTLPDRPNGKLRALIINFDLNRSSYATMALREILRCDTSATSQKELTVSVKEVEEDTEPPSKRPREAREQE